MHATLAAVLGLAVLGAAPPPWEAAPAFTADPVELARAAAALPPPKDADVDVLVEEASFVFDERGRATSTWRMVYRALTRDAAERWSSTRRRWSRRAWGARTRSSTATGAS
jgi:hypothetical protein